MSKIVPRKLSAYEQELYNRQNNEYNMQNANDLAVANQNWTQGQWQSRNSLNNLRTSVNQAATAANNARGSWAGDEYKYGESRQGINNTYSNAKIAYNNALNALKMQKQQQADSNWAATHKQSGGGVKPNYYYYNGVRYNSYEDFLKTLTDKEYTTQGGGGGNTAKLRLE